MSIGGNGSAGANGGPRAGDVTTGRDGVARGFEVDQYTGVKPGAFSAARPSPEMLERIVAFDAARGITTPRWEPVRAIVQHYFVTQYQEFHFVNGCLVLGGGNGTGKTSLLTAFLTLVLDNDKRPERLDPGGSRDRSIAYFVLGEADKRFFHRNRTGYVALEFRHTGTGAYQTVGIGLQGVRAGGDGQARVESWGFLLADGRRIGHDFFLYQEEGGKRIPLSQYRLAKELGADVGTTNRVVEGVEAYQELVNGALFGCRSVQQYRDLLDILTELRASKLDNNIKPTVVNAMLQRSLQPLDPALMEEAGRVYERIDQYQDKLDVLQAQVIVLDDLNKAETSWRKAAARRDAALFRDAYREAERAARRLEKLRGEITRERDVMEATAREISQARETVSQKRGRLDVLVQRDELKDVNKLDEYERRRAEAMQVADHAEVAATQARERHGDAVAHADRLLTQWQREINEALTRARSLSEAARIPWPVAAAWGAAVSTAARTAKIVDGPVQPQVALGAVRADYETRRDALRDIAAAIRAHERAEDHLGQAKERLQAAAEDLQEGSDRFEAERRAEREGRTRAADALRTWAAVARSVVEIPADAVDAAAAAALDTDVDPDVVIDPLIVALDEARERAREEESIRRTEVAAAENELRAASDRLEAKRQERDEAPPAPPERARAREALTSADVAFAPLYLAVDFAEHVAQTDAACLEYVLSNAGLLDALVVEREALSLARTALQILPESGPAAADAWLAPHEPSERLPRAARGSPAASGTAGSGQRTLAEYLVPVEGALPDAAVEEALRAVAVVSTSEDLEPHVAHGRTAISLDGGWVHGALTGHTTGAQSHARYIGLLNRQRAREEAIRLLEAEIAMATGRHEAASAALQRVIDRLHRIARQERDLSQLAAVRALRELRLAVDSAARDVSKFEIRHGEATKHVAQARARVAEAKKMLDDACLVAHWTDARTINAIDLASRVLEGLRRDVDAMQVQLDTCTRTAADHARVTSPLAGLQDDAARAETHLGERRRAVVEAEAAVQAIRDLLARPDVKALHDEVEQLQTSLRDLDGVINEREKEFANAEGRRQTLEEGLPEREENAATLSGRAAARFEVLLNALEVHPGLADEARRARDGVASASRVADTLLADVVVAAQDPIALESARDAAFNAIDKLRVEHTTVLTTLQPVVDPRVGCTFMHHGRQLPTRVLLDELAEEQVKLESMLNESQRTLVQRFLSEEILSAIHGAIKQAQDLVALVNAKLAHLKTSKGRQLRFVWTPVRLAGMATSVADVAKLLETKVKYLSDEDRETLVRFIQERLAYVRASVKRGDAALGYVEALRQALDYRHWYQFSMQAFEKRWVEFTDKKFGAGSNGEKAVDMLAPLFAVVHARYANAAPDAPRLLGMDEAFAGVDSTNTKAMFGLLRDFEFSFVMTSEKLWGVSENLPGCATYQLQVDDAKDPSMLAATFFLWDGFRRVEDNVRARTARGNGGPGGRKPEGQGELTL